jgi:hypothetical protein
VTGLTLMPHIERGHSFTGDISQAFTIHQHPHHQDPDIALPGTMLEALASWFLYASLTWTLRVPQEKYMYSRFAAMTGAVLTVLHTR